MHVHEPSHREDQYLNQLQLSNAILSNLTLLVDSRYCLVTLSQRVTIRFFEIACERRIARLKTQLVYGLCFIVRFDYSERSNSSRSSHDGHEHLIDQHTEQASGF